MRLIDADKLEDFISGPFVQSYKEARDAVMEAPTIDAVPLEPLAKFIVDNLDPRVDCGTCARMADGWEERVCANCPEMSEEQVRDKLKKWMEAQNAPHL